ncbi:F-box protein At5g67140-like isoform X4 [Miscanthus floridulus]|uniref:F-box protein At5g67140-like isoform X2 n=1 Tax=Miscanthus floridulus TaxID=154761 RepID=UPI003458510E
MDLDKQRQHDGDGDGAAAAEADIERLPVDLLAHILSLLSPFRDLSMAGGVSRRWRWAVERVLASRRRLSFAGQRTGNDTAARLIHAAVNLRDLDICWGCHITDEGLIKISSADCVANLTSISLWGLAGITDKGVVHLSIILWSCRHVTEAGLVALVNKCRRLECINVGGMRVPPESFVGLLSISPALQIRSIPRILDAGVQAS